jgi:hypothetical protein
MEKGLPSITRKLDDESDAKVFQFVFYCDCCGQGYRTAPIPFSVRDAPDRTEEFTPAQKLIYETEYDDAYERGNLDALSVFEVCETCGRRICEDCSEGGIGYVCRDCRAKQEDEAKQITGGTDNGK